MVKVALRHTYIVLRMHSVVRHLLDICAVHVRQKGFNTFTSFHAPHVICVGGACIVHA